jgi:uncharacterized tellurite resistance protein B-like protein
MHFYAFSILWKGEILMSFKLEFNDQEWAALQYSFLWIFQAVAGADDNIDEKEKNAFAYIVSNPNNIPCALAVEVLTSLQDEGKAIFHMSEEDRKDTREGLEYVADLLRSSLTHDERVAFKKTLMALGIVVGKASGSWFADKFSDDEFRELKRVANHIDINLDSVMNSGSLNNFFDTMRKK